MKNGEYKCKFREYGSNYIQRYMDQMKIKLVNYSKNVLNEQKIAQPSDQRVFMVDLHSIKNQNLGLIQYRPNSNIYLGQRVRFIDQLSLKPHDSMKNL